MPSYDYACEECGFIDEYRHMMSEEPKYECPECGHKYLAKQMSSTFYVAQSNFAPTAEDRKEDEHRKKVKDMERAVRMRKKAFGTDAVGDPVDKPDPQHIVKKGRTLGGQEMEVDKKEFVQAAAKDPAMVKKAQEAIKKSEQKKK